MSGKKTKALIRMPADPVGMTVESLSIGFKEGFRCGQKKERAAIIKWLSSRRLVGSLDILIAKIKRGAHLESDNESEGLEL